ERRVDAGKIAPLGAASLLARNYDARWPEFAGRDLASRWPRLTVQYLASDGATIGDVFGDQLDSVDESSDETIVTITVGGNDVLNAHIRDAAAARPGAVVADVHAHFLGHGTSVGAEHRWYWKRSLIEPGAIGASEIRRVWLDALDIE